MAEDNSETRGPDWWENATATQVSEVLTQWWDNVVDGPVRHSLGYEEANHLAVWLQRSGVDPQKWLDVNSRLHGDGHTGCMPPSRDDGGLDEIDVINAIMPLRWIVLYVRRLAKDDTGEVARPLLDHLGTLGMNEVKILRTIDKHGSAVSTNDLIEKMNQDGHRNKNGDPISDSSVKTPLSSLKKAGVLVAVSGKNGYTRP